LITVNAALVSKMQTSFNCIAYSLLLAIFIVISPTLFAKQLAAKDMSFLEEVKHNQSVKFNQQIQFRSKPVIGIASFYSDKFNGKRTASGEKFNNSAMTAAHKTLPFGSRVEVTNLRNKKSVVVRINDRGPHIKGRNIDLSKAAARQIGLGHHGTAKVRLQILD
jgi:rare lipoprotein A